MRTILDLNFFIKILKILIRFGIFFKVFYILMMKWTLAQILISLWWKRITTSTDSFKQISFIIFSCFICASLLFIKKFCDFIHKEIRNVTTYYYSSNMHYSRPSNLFRWSVQNLFKNGCNYANINNCCPY